MIQLWLHQGHFLRNTKGFRGNPWEKVSSATINDFCAFRQEEIPTKQDHIYHFAQKVYP